MPQQRSYVIEVTVVVPPHAEHLQTQRAIRAEVRSWLEGLGATVRTIEVRPAGAADVEGR